MYLAGGGEGPSARFDFRGSYSFLTITMAIPSILAIVTATVAFTAAAHVGRSRGSMYRLKHDALQDIVEPLTDALRWL